jgi:protein-L-isoaspartate(D-aspartate) O-methyltransferase
MSELNLEQARYNMIEQQIRPWDVLNQDVLDLLMRLPREDFVPAEYHNVALADMNTPIGNGQVMMAPKVEARMLQALELKPDDTVLEVGTGSGYVTALLASLARHVYSVEIDAELKTAAEQRLAAHSISNVTLEEGDAAQGWKKHAPYDVIVITGSLPTLPDSFKQSLKAGGRLFAIVGDAPAMVAQLITRIGQGEWSSEDLFETELPVLKNALEPDRFVL